MANQIVTRTESGGILLRVSIIVAALYFFLKYGLGWITGWVMQTGRPMPIPSVAVFIFMALGVSGAAVYVISSEDRLRSFLAPILETIRAETGGRKLIRILVAIALPLMVGWRVYAGMAPKVEAPVGLRIQHPTLPGKYEKLENPFRSPSDGAVKAYLAEAGLPADTPLDIARATLAEKYTDEGRGLFQKNCQPCHGCPADGDGPQGRGFRLKPIDFTDTGTIATLVEPYVFWRMKEGWAGLPNDSTPWDSAMPIWGDDLTDDDMWKIILAEYDIAGVEPRRPEKHE